MSQRKSTEDLEKWQYNFTKIQTHCRMCAWVDNTFNHLCKIDKILRITIMKHAGDIL